MSRCSLADDLVAAHRGTEEADWQEAHPHGSWHQQLEAMTAASGSDALSASCDETAAAVQPPDERLLLAGNDPLCIYLQQHRISPDFMLASPPAASHSIAENSADNAGSEEEEEQQESEDEAETSILPPPAPSPYERYAASALSPRQLLLSLCTLLLPCSLLLTRSSSGLHSPGSLWAAALTRSQWRWLHERLQAAGASRRAAPPPLSPLHLTFSLLRLSLMLAAAWLVCAAVLVIAAVGRSLLLLVSLTASAVLWSLLPAAVLVLLVINCWAAAEHLRLASAFHSSSVSLLPLPAVFSLSSQLVSQCLQRITEAETVSRGYYLSARAVSAVLGMDSRQEATRRQAAAVRRTARTATQQMLAALETAQAQLLCTDELEGRQQGAAQTPLTAATVEDDGAAPSIAELKLLRHQLQAAQSAFLTLLTADGQQDDEPVPAALLSRLTSQLSRSNHAIRGCLRLHTRLPPVALASVSASSSSPSGTSALSVVNHRIRSAHARVLLLAHRRTQADSQAVLADLRYINAALQEASRACGDMEAEEQQRTTAEQQQQPGQELQDMRKRQCREEEKEEDEAEMRRGSSGGGGNALLLELGALRRRRGAAAALPEGCGAVFEGDGQRRAQREGSEREDEDDDSVQAKDERRRRLQQRGKAAAVPSGPSLLSASLSMVSELKSVLSHRPAVAFRSIGSEEGES